MSGSMARASPQIIVPRTLAAISRTASKSPGEAIGNPASITSTPRSQSAWAISIFSGRFMLAPGDCSPSRSVVSKILMVRDSDMIWLLVDVGCQFARCWLLVVSCKNEKSPEAGVASGLDRFW